MKRILLVDDNPNFLQSLSIGLKKKQFLVDTAETALDAMQLFNKNEYEVLLTDLKMPGINGMELANLIYKLAPHMLIVIISAYHVDDYKQHFMPLSDYRYLCKPFPLTAITSIIEEHFRETALPLQEFEIEDQRN